MYFFFVVVNAGGRKSTTKCIKYCLPVWHIIIIVKLAEFPLHYGYRIVQCNDLCMNE
jgi:hypothetical protein